MLSVSDNFHRLARGQIIEPRTRAHISFSKEKRDDVQYFTLDQSFLNGSDLLAPTSDNPIQLWDTYIYDDYSNRIIEYTLSRSLAFPNSAQSAILDIKLNDYDKTVSYPNNTHGLPKRPVRLFEGFIGDPNSVQSFVGLTQGVATRGDDRTVTLTCMDFLTEIGDQTLRNIVKMRNATTDQVLAAIVEQFGVTELQYDFDRGNNIIPFVFMDTQKNAGNAIAELVLAEGGRFWQDEEGILRFRRRLEERPSVSAIYTEEDIVSITPQAVSGIYNVVNIECEVRKVQPLQEIFSAETDFNADSEDYYIGANGSYSIFLNLDDPAWTANPPVLNGVATSSNFTVARTNGIIVSSGVSAEGTLFTDSYKITFTNNNNFPVRVITLSLWGEPARVVDTIKYSARDTDSVGEFGEIPLDLTDNSYIATMANARSLATEIVARRSSYNSLVDMECKYDPSLQIGDTISVETKDITGDYAIIGMDRTVSSTGVNAVYYLELDWRLDVTWFILDKSVLNGPDILG